MIELDMICGYHTLHPASVVIVSSSRVSDYFHLKVSVIVFQRVA